MNNPQNHNSAQSGNNALARFNQPDIQQLKEKMTGNVLLPGEDRYNDARKSWALLIEHEPAIIIEVKNTDDVITAVHFARERQLFIAVQTTGHGASHPCKGHLLIKTNLLNSFSIDATAQTATVEAGATWENILTESQHFGLAPLSGFINTVGVTGYHIGGGFGWLVRKYGLAVDQLLSFDVVCLNDELLKVTATDHPDLFWGICAGGNFGIITALTIKLLPVQDVVASKFYYLPGKVREVLEAFRTATGHFPEEMSSVVTLMHLPSAALIPKAVRKMEIISVKTVFLGDEQTNERLLLPFKELGPIYEKQEILTYLKGSQIGDEPTSPEKVNGRMEILNELTPNLTGVLNNLIAGSEQVKPVIELRHVEGAMARVPAGKNAFGHRDGKYILQAEVPLKGETTQELAADYLHNFAEAVKPFVTGGAYLNFIGNVDIGDDIVKAAYHEEDYVKLRQLKRQYDPNNILRFNYNIPPAEV